MGISPWYVGQLLPLWIIPFVDDSGQVLPLSTATMSINFHNLNTNSVTPGAGTFVVTNAAAGIATYTPAPADVATAGNYTVQPIATINGKPEPGDPISWILS